MVHATRHRAQRFTAQAVVLQARLPRVRHALHDGFYALGLSRVVVAVGDVHARSGVPSRRNRARQTPRCWVHKNVWRCVIRCTCKYNLLTNAVLFAKMSGTPYIQFLLTSNDPI